MYTTMQSFPFPYFHHFYSIPDYLTSGYVQVDKQSLDEIIKQPNLIVLNVETWVFWYKKKS